MHILMIGAGKIARGFIGHLLWKSGYSFQFVEYCSELAELLNQRKHYSVRILGETIHTDEITGFGAWDYNDLPEIIESIATDTTTIFISVGGKNLTSVAKVLTPSLAERMARGNTNPLNIVLCENWIKPGTILRNAIEEAATPAFKEYLAQHVGFIESVIMRSAIEPTKEVLDGDPLAVNVQDFWYLPVDQAQIKAPLPDLEGLAYIDDFNGYLDRKFYTYNAANGTVSYLGNLKNYTYIYEAATDPDIVEILEQVYKETGKALCAKHGFDYETHMEFTRTSLHKLQNKYLVDYVERNARDPIRKLGPSDRLVGPARLVIQYGGIPHALATAIAAALFYEQPSDPIALQLKHLRTTKGIDYLLSHVCGLNPDSDTVLITLIKEKIQLLKSKGWIKTDEL